MGSVLQYNTQRGDVGVDFRKTIETLMILYNITYEEVHFETASGTRCTKHRPQQYHGPKQRPHFAQYVSIHPGSHQKALILPIKAMRHDLDTARKETSSAVAFVRAWWRVSWGILSGN